MKYNLKNCPIKRISLFHQPMWAWKTDITAWFVAFERELREMKQHAHDIHALQVYREVLGE